MLMPSSVGDRLRMPLRTSNEGRRSVRLQPTPTRRQDKPLLFARNGPAVVAVRTRVVMDGHTLYGPDTRGLVMSREDSFDIDDAFDLEVAERLMAPRTAAPAHVR